MTGLAGAVALVSGATNGIGLEASVELARRGAHVALVARDAARGQRALDDVKRRSGSSAVSLWSCDFAEQAQVRALAERFRARHDRLDVLLNNAGSVSDTRRVTPDGLEQTFAVNHLGYYLLTRLVLDLLLRSAPARVVNVASSGHRRGDLDFDDLQLERGYSILRAYRRSKLANVLFTRELARRLEGRGVTVNAVHPGHVDTQIWSRAPWFARPALAVARRFMITPAEGGDRLVHLAADAEVDGQTGGYYDGRRRVEPAPLARDDALARRLWDVSAALVKLPAELHL